MLFSDLKNFLFLVCLFVCFKLAARNSSMGWYEMQTSHMIALRIGFGESLGGVGEGAEADFRLSRHLH